MSVLVKGMEMPKDCNNCKFFNDNYDYPTCSVTDHSRGYNWNPRGQRMPDCPLVEVLSHGRLIDADALEVTEKTWWEQGEDDEFQCYSAFYEEETIEDAPTIIEAEE